MAPVETQWQALLLVLLLALALCEETPNKRKESISDSKPNIVFVLVDDWGWANVGYHRDPPTKEIDTPNIDGLVKDGLELDQHYTYSFCSPSRSSFLSGRLPIHVNDKNVPLDHYNPDDPVSGVGGISRNMTLISAKMNSAGYISHQVGKWHAGASAFDQLPIGRGFNSSFGYLNGMNDYYTEKFGVSKCNGTALVDFWDTDKPASGKNGTDYEETLFKDRVLEVVKAHDNTKPLFLYYAPHLVHAPLEIPDTYANKFSFIDNKSRQLYSAMTKYLDDIVGDLKDMLTQRGMWNNTLFVLSSDNGGPLDTANNFPLKGGKYSDWQGGVRVNAFVSGGYLPEKMRGQKTEGYIHIADWYATFCALAGVDPTDDMAAKAKLPPIDSLNMWPLISGENSTSPRMDIPLSKNALISGDYKILVGDVHEAGWTGPQYPNNSKSHGINKLAEHCGDGCLYNIKDDPLEHVNVALKMTDVLKQMQSKLQMYQKGYFNPDRGTQSKAACDMAMSKYGGFWGPFLH